MWAVEGWLLCVWLVRGTSITVQQPSSASSPVSDHTTLVSQWMIQAPAVRPPRSLPRPESAYKRVRALAVRVVGRLMLTHIARGCRLLVCAHLCVPLVPLTHSTSTPALPVSNCPITMHHCWYCPRSFSSPAQHSRHMLAAHPGEDRLMPPASWQHPGSATPVDHDVVMADPLVYKDDSDDDLPGLVSDSEDDGFWADDVAPDGNAGEVDSAPTGNNADDDAGVEDINVGPGRSPQVRDDGMERGSLGDATSGASPQTASISSRIVALYATMPETDTAEPCVKPEAAQTPSFFDTHALHLLLRFIVTCGGSGLSRVDLLQLASKLLALEPEVRHDGDENNLADRLGTPHALVSAVGREERRVLARRSWMRVFMDIGDYIYAFFFRDMLQCVKEMLRKADAVQLVGVALSSGPSGGRCRSHTMDSDRFLTEQDDVR